MLKLVKETKECEKCWKECVSGDSCCDNYSFRTISEYDCNVEVKLAGDSIWGCDLEKVTIEAISVEKYLCEGRENANYHSQSLIGVKHSGGEDSWTMYTDTGFEEEISNLLGYTVWFTEQGMQEDGCASLESYH